MFGLKDQSHFPGCWKDKLKVVIKISGILHRQVS